jgi:hypothetical protein
MNTWDEDELEKFIKSNKSKFDVYQPEPGHQQLFLKKLLNKFREVISIVPYLVKVGVATVLIFALSFLVWRMFICPPLTHISLKYWRVEHDYRYQINRNTRLIYSFIDNHEDSVRIAAELKKFDDSYNVLKKQLRKNPSPEGIVSMLGHYKEELLALEEEVQNYRNKDR